MNPWRKTKRNHGLEHATISLLLGRPAGAGRPVAGYSVPTGFIIVGDLPTGRVEEAAREALRLMQNGERGLAVSPFCGTTIIVTAALAAAASINGYQRAGGGARGFNRAFSNSAMAIVAARPIGRIVQERCTTSADVGAMSILSVTPKRVGSVPIHWIATRFDA